LGATSRSMATVQDGVHRRATAWSKVGPGFAEPLKREHNTFTGHFTVTTGVVRLGQRGRALGTTTSATTAFHLTVAGGGQPLDLNGVAPILGVPRINEFNLPCETAAGVAGLGYPNTLAALVNNSNASDSVNRQGRPPHDQLVHRAASSYGDGHSGPGPSTHLYQGAAPGDITLARS